MPVDTEYSPVPSRLTAIAISVSLVVRWTVAVRMARDAIHRGADMPLDEGLGLEADLTAFLYTTDDAREGPRAFIEKRAPQWSGR